MISKELSNLEYHRGKGISKSDLDKIHISLAHYRAWKENPPDIDSIALKFGTAFHTAVLEPERFEAEYVLAPEGDKRRKDVREAWAELEQGGLKPLSKEDWDAVQGMKESVLANPIARALVLESEHETSAYAEINGVTCKCRPDIWHAGKRVIADLKSTADASEKGFSKSCAKFRYHVQDSWYRMVWEEASGITPRAFVFIAVEKTPPYALALYSLDEESKEQGSREMLDDLNTYRMALENDSWPGYAGQIQSISLPLWALD